MLAHNSTHPYEDTFAHIRSADICPIKWSAPKSINEADKIDVVFGVRRGETPY